MTDQSHSFQAAGTRELDDIREFCGAIGAAEYDERRKLRTARNLATYKVTQAQSPSARQLLWMCAQCAASYVYLPCEFIILAEAAQFCGRLLKLAEQAEYLECPDGVA